MTEIATDELLTDAAEALQSGDWRRAAALYRSSCAEEDSGEARLGLATALWCGYEVEAALDEMKAAYRLFRDSDLPARAALVACWIALEEVGIRGNPNVARGWFGRAARLLDGVGPCPERGWCEVWRASFEGDPRRLAEVAAEGAELGRRFGDPDLEMLCLAERGHALVIMGRITEGMALLDEAMAGVVGGEATSPLAVSDCLCVMVTACENAHDLRRAEEWCQVALETSREKSIAFLAANCRTSYGAILAMLGRHQEAENELRQVLRMLKKGYRHFGPEALARLADLRRRQGRLEEAGRLVRQAASSAATLRVETELAIESGDHRRALELARQMVSRAGPRVTEEAVAWHALVRAAALGGEIAEAESALAELERAASAIGTGPMIGSLWLARASLAQAKGNLQDAIAAYWEAARLYTEAGDVFDAARARLRLAAALRLEGREEEGAREESLAREALARIQRPTVAPSLTPRELDVVTLLATGLSNAAIAAQLGLSPHTVHRHVASVLRRLDVPTRAAAAAEAARLGLV